MKQMVFEAHANFFSEQEEGCYGHWINYTYTAHPRSASSCLAHHLSNSPFTVFPVLPELLLVRSQRGGTLRTNQPKQSNSPVGLWV